MGLPEEAPVSSSSACRLPFLSRFACFLTGLYMLFLVVLICFFLLPSQSANLLEALAAPVDWLVGQDGTDRLFHHESFSPVKVVREDIK